MVNSNSVKIPKYFFSAWPYQKAQLPQLNKYINQTTLHQNAPLIGHSLFKWSKYSLTILCILMIDRTSPTHSFKNFTHQTVPSTTTRPPPEVFRRALSRKPVIEQEYEWGGYEHSTCPTGNGLWSKRCRYQQYSQFRGYFLSLLWFTVPTV